MKKCEKTINLNGEKHTVLITYKDVKRMTIRVRGSEIFLSAPKSATEKRIEEFLHSTEKWLIKCLEKNKLRDEVSANKVIFLGEKYQLSIKSGAPHTEIVGDTFFVYAPDGDRAQAKRVFELNWRKTAMEIFTEETAKAYAECKEVFGIRFFPKITLAKVKGYWGKCFSTRGEIRYNVYLLQADMSYIRYVVYHELTHYKHHNHGKDFYDALRKVYKTTDIDKKKGKLYRTTMWTDLD